MRTRSGHGIEVRPERTDAAGEPGGGSGQRPDPDATATMSARGLVIAGLVLVLVLGLVVTIALVLSGAGGGDVVTEGDPPAAVRPAGVAPLGLTVGVLAPVIAGQRARLTVRWTDGSGIFSGSSEDWGDGLGTSSRRQGRCEPATVVPPPAGETFVVRHTWGEPGTYTVGITVAAYVCESGSAVEEEATTTLTVDVLPAG